MNKLFTLISILFFAASCGSDQNKEAEEVEILSSGDTTPVKLSLERFNWLEGNWSAKNKDGSLSFENWKKLNDSTMVGNSYVLSGKDTLFSEKMSLEERNSNINYIPVVSNQNDGKPVPFELMSFGPGTIIFENTEHDFPTHIQYILINSDSLVAEISGKKKGKKAKEIFPYKRIK